MTTSCPEAGPRQGRLPAAEVQRMFAEITPRYDLLNHLLSFGLDRLWRRRLARQVRPPESAGATLRVADLCCGTGDLAADLARRAGPGSEVLGLDFCRPMIDRARRKYGALPGVRFAVADAMSLPLADGAFDVVAVAFGVRNVENLDAALSEMVRVTRRGGCILILEFCPPEGAVWGAIFGFYFGHLLPIVGCLISGHRSAYRYLQASVGRFPGPGELASRLERAGACDVRPRRLIGGVAALTVATRSGPGHRE